MLCGKSIEAPGAIPADPAHRYRSEERLLRFLVALADNTVTRENTSWRRATVGLLLQFLESLTSAEPHAESLAIRKSLLPTHLGVMSACLEEALIQSSDEKRLELLSRAHRLRAAFPTWPSGYNTVFEMSFGLLTH
jgi:hypothetical protein